MPAAATSELLLAALAGLCLLVAWATDDIRIAVASLVLVGLAIVGLCLVGAVRA